MVGYEGSQEYWRHYWYYFSYFLWCEYECMQNVIPHTLNNRAVWQNEEDVLGRHFVIQPREFTGELFKEQCYVEVECENVSRCEPCLKGKKSMTNK